MAIKLSIIVPCYNSALYINKTIISLTEQTYKDFEVIFVNDGSTDDTVKVIRTCVSKSNLKFKIIEQKNEGVSAARNKGVENSIGKYICFLDSDDTIKNTFLDKMINKIESENLDMVFCGFNFVNNNNEILTKYTDKYRYISRVESGKQIVKLMLREKIWICIGNAIYKREIINRYNIQHTIGCCNGEDQEFIYKYLIHSNNVHSITEELMAYYQRCDSMVHSVSLKKFTVLGAINRIIKYYKKLGVDEDIVIFLENNKFQKEFLRNMLSMISEAHKCETMIKIIDNKKFNRNIRKFRILTMKKTPILDIKEIAFIIKVWIYLNIPYIYNKNLRYK